MHCQKQTAFIILFTAPTVANPSTRTMYTCTRVHCTCTRVHCTAQVANPCTCVHVHTTRQHRISFPAENLSKFSLLTYRFPPQWCWHQQQSSQCCPLCVVRLSPLVYLSVWTLGWKRCRQTHLPPADHRHQRATDGCQTSDTVQHKSAMVFHQCIAMYHQCTTNVPKCNQPPMFFGVAPVLQKVYHQFPVWCWCDCLVYHKYCHAVPQVFQCFIATWCIAVMWVHNPPSYPLATDQLSPRCILPTFCIFSSNLRIHTFVNSPILYTVGISVHNMKVDNVYNVWDALKHRVLCA